MPQPDLIIFDCDGVLVDSEIIAARVEADLITKAGYAIEAEELAERYAGLTFHDILLAVEKEAAMPLQASLIAEAERLVDRRLKAEVRAMDGARAAVAAVRGKKCICSNSSAERLDMMLSKTGLKEYFDGHVFSARDTPSRQPKPAPDVFLFAAEKMEAEPARSFVLEDSVHGVAAAHAAGMKVVGFTGGSHSYPGHADLLTEAGAVTVINRLSDLAPMVRALSEWSE
jgi:HAD superfamily hydrolase (TIGR01509 family)